MTPDGYETCGSVRDYYEDLTDGQIIIDKAVFDPIEEGDPVRHLLINPDGENEKPEWLDMESEFGPYTADFRLLHEDALEKCIDLGWLPEPENPPEYPGFDVILFVYAGGDEGMVGEELDYPLYKGRSIPGAGNAGVIASTVCETRHGSTGGAGHLLQMGVFVDEIFDPLTYDLYPIFGWDQDMDKTYSWYPRAAYIGDWGTGNYHEQDSPGDYGGGFVGEYDNACWSGGDFCKIDGWMSRTRRVENNAAYWNPRERIAMSWYDDANTVYLPEDHVGLGMELNIVDETEAQPAYIVYKYIDAFDGETPIYGSFYLESKRVRIGEEDYRDFNSKGVGWNGCVSVNGNPHGYTETQNENNLVIWHAEDQGPQIHVQFGDGHGYCTNEDGSLNNLSDLEIDGFERLNGNDYFPSIVWGTEDEVSDEFGPGTFQNRSIPAIDYSSVDLCRFDTEVDGINGYDIKQTGFCVKSIYDDRENDRITCDVYTNYWGGDIVEDLVLEGQNIYLGQDPCIDAPYSVTLSAINDNCTARLDDNLRTIGGGDFNITPGFNTCDFYMSDHQFRISGDGALGLSGGVNGEINIYGPGEFLSLLQDETIIENNIVTFDGSGWELSINNSWRVENNGILKLKNDDLFETCRMILSSNLIIDQDGELHIYDGVELVFLDGATIRIIGNGRLVIHDEDAQPTDFTSGEENPGPGDWEGIIYEDITQAQTLEHVNIEYATNGIKATNCGSYLTFDNVNITDFQSTGINLVNSSPTIDSCSASGSPTAGSHLPTGLYLYNSSPTVTYCEFDDNAMGIEVSGSSSMLELGNSSVCDNDSAGVTFYNGCGYMYYTTFYPDQGANTITGNGAKGGVYVPGTAYLYMGSGSTSPGNNSIYNNTPYEINNICTYTVYAENNWWNDVMGPTAIYGLVDYTPWLTSAPGGSFVPETPNPAKVGLSVIADAMDDAIEQADSLYAEGEFRSALTAYQRIVASDPADRRSQHAIMQVHACLVKLDREGDLQGWIDGLLENDRIDARAGIGARRLLAHLEQRQGRHGNAYDRLEDLRQGLDNEDEEIPFILFDRAMVQHYGLGEVEQAMTTLRTIIRQYADHPISQMAIRELAECSRDLPEVDSPDIPADEETGELPSGFELIGCYPNPFNSSVQIKYALPEQVKVTVAIHDLSGRQIATLFDGTAPAGIYTQTWTATDNPSGVYLCRIKAGNSIISEKLTLVR